MKKTVVIFIFATLIFTGAVAQANSSFTLSAIPTAAVVKETKNKKTTSYRQLKQLWEQQLGRKLRFSERMGLRVLMLSGDPDPLVKKRANSNALLGFAFGLGGLLLLGLLAIPGLILSNQALREEKRNPGTLDGDRLGLAQAGRIMSIISLVLLGIVLLLVILLFSISFATI